MTAIGARHVMRHRFDIAVDVNFGLTDEAGYDLDPEWLVGPTDLPGYLMSDFRSGFSGEFEVGGGRFQVVRTLYRLMVPRDSALTNFDQVVEIRKKNGEPLYSGILTVDNSEVAEGYMVYYLTERR